MYPKPSEEIRNAKIRHLSVGHKHVVVTTDDGQTFAQGSSPCYGELGFGVGEQRSSSSFSKVETLAGVNVLGIACG